MYLPRHFAEDDPASLRALMGAFPRAAIVRAGSDGLAADHVPLSYDPASRTLRGHVARANPLWREGASPGGLAVLAIFRAEQAYVSPNWYPAKARTHQAVPTWNYAVVHAHGRLQAVDDAGWLRAFLGQLTARHEATQPQPWELDDAPADYLERMLRAVVGIEISVERLVGKLKLSQNRDAADQAGVLDGLAAQGTPDALAMAARLRARSG